MNIGKEKTKFIDRPKVDPLGEEQIARSRAALQQRKQETSEVITKIQKDSEAAENQRRMEEERRRKDRANQIQTEVITSHKKNVDIEWTWGDLEDKEDAEELHAEIEKQKKACQEIIDEKNRLIKQFEQQLEDKDNEYYKSIKKQEQDIDELIRQMRSQFIKMREDYITQLSEIDNSFKDERKQILERNLQEINDLFNQHSEIEEQAQMNRARLEEDYQQQLEQLRTKDANDQAEQKRKLETEMQVLEQCMEDMKAVYKLNEEKLDFNLKVLKERKLVNEGTIKSLTLKQRRSRDTLSKAKKRFEDQSKEFKRKNIQLTEGYKEFTRKFKELQEKFKRFEKSDQIRFNEIWQMNDQEVKQLIRKIVDADKVIHTQQLGISWHPPSDPFFSFINQEGAPVGGSSQINHNTSNMESSKHGVSKSEMDQAEGGSPSGGLNQEFKVSIQQVKQVFNILIEETPFLVDDKTLEHVIGKNPREAYTMKVDSIRKSLNIDNMEDVEKLVLCFYEQLERQRRAQTEEQEGEEKVRSEEDEEEEKKGEDKIEINQLNGDETLDDLDLDEVLIILENFNEKRRLEAENQDLQGNPRMSRRNNAETEEQKRERIKRDERLFWEKMTEVLPENKLALWRALDKALSKYYQLLVDRQNLIEDTGLLNQQNEELKTLLNQYLQAGVNHELRVPPTQVIRLDI